MQVPFNIFDEDLVEEALESALQPNSHLPLNHSPAHDVLLCRYS